VTTAYFYLTPEGKQLAEKLAASHPGEIYGKENFKDNLREGFGTFDYLVCIMATGIVVRILAPLICHKTSDPGVVVMDQKGRYAISLLSGHLGGANDLAREMAAISGGQAVITTATDVAGEISFDTFAKKYRMAIENIGELKHISGALLEGKSVGIITDYPVSAESFPELREGLERGRFMIFPTEKVRSHTDSPAFESLFPGGLPLVVIDEGFSFTGEERKELKSPVLYLRPRTICAGIGCKRDMAADPIREALLDTLKKEGLSPLSLKCISTIPLKADEPGILTTASRLKVPLKVIPTEEIEALDIADLGIQTSDYVTQHTGVPSVSTASSYLASGRGKILVDKAKYKGITIALSRADISSGQ